MLSMIAHPYTADQPFTPNNETIQKHKRKFHASHYFRILGRASILRRLKVNTLFFLVGLGVFERGEGIGAMTRGAISAGPSETVAFRFFGERSSSFSPSSSESGRRRFLFGIPWGMEGRGALFSLLVSGKLPGMGPEKMLERTCRTLAWPGEDPNPFGGVPKFMMCSLRKWKVPGMDGAGRGSVFA
jgi:hypothetical protein